MMARFYYLVAQLPPLRFDAAPGIDLEGLHREAGKWLPARDAAVLRDVDLNDISPSGSEPAALRRYKAFQIAVRHDVAAFRQARRAGREYRPQAFPLSVVREGNPLEVERKLLGVSWSFVDASARQHHFDLAALIYYSLKLQILLRLSRFDGARGMTVFRRLCEVTP